jgi:ubiquinone/menaquinone biosynthesis C-methylase UbiE
MNAMTHVSTPTPDLAAIKQRQQAAWSSGNYAVVGTTLQIVGERLAEVAQVRWDEDVLDVAAGNGNASLAAARRGGWVTSTDYVPALLELGRQRAEAEQLPINFREADAEDLPFGNGSFDLVLSTFGVMFTPDHAQAANELLRVCRPGGRIAMANWTPEGFIGQMFKVLGRHLPPPAGLTPPSAWGTLAHLQQLFGDEAAAIIATPRVFNFRYRSAEHMIEVFRTWYGPVQKAFAALPADKAAQLHQDLAELMERFDGGGHAAPGRGALVVPSEYLEIVITRR